MMVMMESEEEKPMDEETSVEEVDDVVNDVLTIESSATTALYAML